MNNLITIKLNPFLLYLNTSHDTGRLHPARHVDRVAPDVVLRFLRPNDTRHNASLESEKMVLI